MRIFGTLIIAAMLLTPAFAAEKTETTATVGQQIDDFSLQDFRGEQHNLTDFADSKLVAVAFLGTECPLAKLYGPRLQKLADEYEAQGVTFLGIYPNRQDSISEIANFARVLHVEFPLLKDVGNLVADQFGAERTPQVFLLDENRVVRYAGRVDDQYGIDEASTGYANQEVRRRHLAEAIDELLAGKSVTEPLTEAPGCIIGRIREVSDDTSVTYANQISRILQKHCVECHREGEIAPFSLTDYEEVVGWAEMMQEVVEQQRMPPWHADPKYGHFANDRSMTSEEKELLYTWVANGAPLGDVSQLPEPKVYPTGWQAGEPDEVFHMSAETYTVPAEGTVEYQYFYVDPGWTEDKWIDSSECLIDNRAVVHHIFVFAIPPDVEMEPWEGARSQGADFSGGLTQLIGGAAPGTPPMDYHIEGMAAFVEAGTKLLFQMHYTPIGHEVTDRSSVGFRYADPETVRHRVKTNLAINFAFNIPAGANNHPVNSERKLNEDTLIMSFAPHMHLRGKSFRYDVEYPDGTVETLLNVPRYDFNWQMVYALAEPKFIPAGSTLKCYAHFDNSSDNLANPDPTHDVTWGDQTWEEMMIGWFNDSNDIDYGSLDRSYWRSTRFEEAMAEGPPRISSLLKRAAARVMKNDTEIDKFLSRTQKIVPQVDRICVATVDGETLSFLRVSQAAVLHAALRKDDITFAADSAALADFCTGQETIVNSNVGDLNSADMSAMAARLRSSMHVPVVIDGKPAVVSFWSTEPEAFPPAAVEILEPIAKLVGDDQ